MDTIKIGVVGVGNCASSLIQGIHYYRGKTSEDATGLMHWDIGGYKPYDIEVVAAQAFQAAPPASDIYLHVTLAPDIPAQYGGSVEFSVGGICLSDIGIGGNANFDGRAAKYIPYDAVYHSGKWEFRFKHGAGVVHRLTIVLELFRA